METVSKPRFEETFSYRVGRIYNGGILYISDEEGRPLLYKLREDGKQKLLETDRALSYTLDRENGYIFLTHDLGGNERWMISILRDGEEVHRIGDGESINYVGWPDTESMEVPYSSNRDDPAKFKLYIYNYRDGEEREVYGPVQGLYGAALSPGGELASILIFRSSSDVELLIIDRESGEEVSRLGGEGDVVYLPKWIDRDTLTVVTDVGRDKLYLAKFHVDGGLEPIVEAEWDVEAYGMLAGKYLYSLNIAGDSRLFIGDEPVDKPMGVVNLIDAYGGEAIISMDTVRYGESIWRLVDTELKPLLYADIFDELREYIVEPEILRFHSWDGLPIDVILYKPRRSPPYPLILNPHGGPESQSRPRYSPLIQRLVNLGYAVAQPNYRGGTGYGKRFKEMDRVEKRVDSLRDVLETVKTLIEAGIAKPEKIGIMGGSYGGYVTLYMVTHHPKTFRAAVSVVGIANLETFLRNTGPWRRSHREYKYGSLEKDRDTLRRLSPIHYIENVEAPLLLIHGRNDPRVPVEESIMMYEKLREKGVETELVIYEDEGHGVVKKENRLDYMERVVNWFLRHMPP